ncbi:MAG TPA: endolytic transglycosylase MltG, partial [Nannocystaceae bacterium]|nr:endolytic transglycosylase MltG [Nannocystaceae bacterium]
MKRRWWQLKRSRRAQRWALVAVILSLVALVWFARSTWDHIVAYPERPAPGTSDPIAVVIPQGASFPQTLALLVENGVIPEDDATSFRLFVLHKGAARKVTAGPHNFRGDMTPVEVLDELQRKQQRKAVRVTVPEGKNILEVAQIIAAGGVSDATSLEAAMRDPALLAELGIPGQTAEGYLFPDTYSFNVDEAPAKVVSTMVARHRE